MPPQQIEHYVQPVLRNISESSSTAERKLQFAMMFPLRAICALAELLTKSQLEYSLEPVVCSVPRIGQPGVIDQLSDLSIVRLLTFSNSPGGVVRKIVAIIELKYGGFEMVRSKPFAQLIHATAQELANCQLRQVHLHRSGEQGLGIHRGLTCSVKLPALMSWLEQQVASDI